MRHEARRGWWGQESVAYRAAKRWPRASSRVTLGQCCWCIWASAPCCLSPFSPVGIRSSPYSLFRFVTPSTRYLFPSFFCLSLCRTAREIFSPSLSLSLSLPGENNRKTRDTKELWAVLEFAWPTHIWSKKHPLKWLDVIGQLTLYIGISRSHVALQFHDFWYFAARVTLRMKLDTRFLLTPLALLFVEIQDGEKNLIFLRCTLPPYERCFSDSFINGRAN